MSILLVHSQNTDKRSIAILNGFAEFRAFLCVATTISQRPCLKGALLFLGGLKKSITINH